MVYVEGVEKTASKLHFCPLKGYIGSFDSGRLILHIDEIQNSLQGCFNHTVYEFRINFSATAQLHAMLLLTHTYYIA